jgi:hypothetical protein
MELRELAELHADCVQGWTEQAESGRYVKTSKRLTKYRNGCPACEIAERAQRYIQSRIEGQHDYKAGEECRHCPIDVFREHLGPNSSGSVGIGCEYAEDSPYREWVKANSERERTVHATAMTKLNWTYLPIYEFI